MGEMPGGSVDAVITDPPYGTTDLAWDKAARGFDWPRWWSEVKRVARPDAAFVLFAAQPFATDLINSNRKAFRYDLVWAKNTAVGFLDANRRPLRSHELVLVFGHRIKYRRVDWPREVMNLRAGQTLAPVRSIGRHYGECKVRTPYVYRETECPKSVLRFRRPGNTNATRRPWHHPTAKPLALMGWLVRTYCGDGETVLDPFAGSGTTAVACLNTGRRFVGCELDPTYHAVAQRRIAAARSAADAAPSA
jgi:site-specific DNA-methyltransferase (adenine-specific)